VLRVMRGNGQETTGEEISMRQTSDGNEKLVLTENADLKRGR
jgi:hypothetical protein